MSRRDLSQPSFADAFVTGYARGFLEDIGDTFDWGAFEGLLAPIHSSTKGAPGYPPLTMFKIILLQQWHTLSDPAAEDAVRDRLSFRRFCGLPLDRETPDHASIWRFRQTIDKLGLSRALLAETNRQLDARGLVVNRRLSSFLFAGWLPHANYASWGCLGLTLGDRLCRSQFSEEGSPNRRRRPGHRLVCRAFVASQPVALAGEAKRPIAQMNPTSSRAMAVSRSAPSSALPAFADIARKVGLAPSMRWSGFPRRAPRADAACPVLPSQAFGRPRRPRRSVCARQCCLPL
jgi:hypothetical protein